MPQRQPAVIWHAHFTATENQAAEFTVAGITAITAAEFTEAEITDIEITGIGITGVDHALARLTIADCIGAKYTEALIDDSDSAVADFIDTGHPVADFMGTEFTGTMFTGTTFTGTDVKVAE